MIRYQTPAGKNGAFSYTSAGDTHSLGYHQAGDIQRRQMARSVPAMPTVESSPEMVLPQRGVPNSYSPESHGQSFDYGTGEGQGPPGGGGPGPGEGPAGPAGEGVAAEGAAAEEGGASLLGTLGRMAMLAL